MQIRNARPPAKSATADEFGDLLDCRMEMLGLDRAAAANTDRKALEDIMRQCERCGYREACTADVKRDPNDPVWETYCPNAAALIKLSESRWKTN